MIGDQEGRVECGVRSSLCVVSGFSVQDEADGEEAHADSDKRILAPASRTNRSAVPGRKITGLGSVELPSSWYSLGAVLSRWRIYSRPERLQTRNQTKRRTAVTPVWSTVESPPTAYNTVLNGSTCWDRSSNWEDRDN